MSINLVNKKLYNYIKSRFNYRDNDMEFLIGLLMKYAVMALDNELSLSNNTSIFEMSLKVDHIKDVMFSFIDKVLDRYMYNILEEDEIEIVDLTVDGLLLSLLEHIKLLSMITKVDLNIKSLYYNPFLQDKLLIDLIIKD